MSATKRIAYTIHTQRKEQRKLTIAAAAERGENADEPQAKRQRTEEEEREWVSRLGGRGSRNHEWFNEVRKKGQRVVVDLGFDDLMNEREVTSLVTQVLVCSYFTHSLSQEWRWPSLCMPV